MTRTELESFLAVVQAGSLSAAAKNLYITQPALSRRIQSLEQELGYPLLQRSPGVRKATLTAQGEQFVSLATQWMGIWNEAQEIPARLSRKSYTIATNDSIEVCLLPPVLYLLAQQDPEVDVRMLSLHSAEAYLYMERGQADIAFISDARYSKNIDTVNLSSEKFVLLSDPNMKLPGDVTPEVLDGAKEIYMNWTPGFDRWHRYWFRMPRPHLQVDSTAFLAYMLSRGGYWAVVPVSVADYIRKQVELSCSRLIQPPPDRVCCCLTKPQRQPMDELLFSCIREVYREQDRIQILL